MENQSKPAPLTLEALGGKRLPGNAITYKGWHFQAKKGSILNGMDVSRLEIAAFPHCNKVKRIFLAGGRKNLEYSGFQKWFLVKMF